MQLKRLDKFKLPLTGQQIELQQVDYEGGGMSQLRVLIRERSRFTTLDVDPVTAKYWGVALCQWAEDHTPSRASDIPNAVPKGGPGEER